MSVRTHACGEPMSVDHYNGTMKNPCSMKKLDNHECDAFTKTKCGDSITANIIYNQQNKMYLII